MNDEGETGALPKRSSVRPAVKGSSAPVSSPPPVPRELLAELRRAVGLLTPVEVDLGPSQPRFRSFVDSVQGRGSDSRLVLSPIAAGAIPPISSRWVRIRPRDARSEWVLGAPGIEPCGERSAAVELRRARLDQGRARLDQGRARLDQERAQPDQGPTAIESGLFPASDSLVLVVPGGVDDEKAYVFPVSEIGPSACAIEATKPFEPGTELRHVEIVGDRRLLRQASARVLESVAWYMADGTARFRCHLELGPRRVPDSSGLYDLITEAPAVRRLMELAGVATAVGWCETLRGGRNAVRVAEVGSDAALLELLQPERFDEVTRASLQLSLELFSVHYEMVVRLLKRQSDTIRVTLPLVVQRRRHHRRADRVPVPADFDLAFRFRNPATGRFSERRVLALSFVGLSFAAKDEEDVLWKSLPLEEAELSWRGSHISLGDLETRAVAARDSATTCHTAIVKPGMVDNRTFIDLVARLGHPEVTVHGGEDFSSLIEIYKKAGLFAPFMHRNLQPMILEARSVWTKLHTGAPDIIRTLVHGPPHAPDAAVTALRAWERAWMAQHLVDVGTVTGGAAGKLQLAYVDHVLPRPDGHFLLFFVKADNRRMNAFYERFFAGAGTSESVTRITVELWSRNGELADDFPPAADRYRVRPCPPSDEVLVSRAARRSFGDLPAAALSMLPGELSIPDTAARFAKAGLLRGRGCRLVLDREQPLYAIIEEYTPPGLNLTWMLNASWIFPIHASSGRSEAGMRAALRSLLDLPAQSPVGDRFVIVPEGGAGLALPAAGFQKLASVFLYVLNRAGVHRYYYYTARRYGEVGARIERRRVRASVRPEAGPPTGSS